MPQLSFLSTPDIRPRAVAIRELPDSEKPVNRLYHFGAAALSTGELLTIIAGTQYYEDANNLMVRFGNVSGLTRAALQELEQLPGIGPTAAARIKAALELGRRQTLDRDDDRWQIRSPADAANLIMGEMMLLDQEHFVVILLDTKNRVKDIHLLYKGSLNTSMIRVGEVFREAIRTQAASIVIAHNHPSGDPTPSPEDVAVTRQLVEASKLLDIDILDHLIIGHNRFVSLKERGLGFS
jgi:DNA repair protein RadC